MSATDFWKDPENAKYINQKYESLRNEIDTWEKISHDVYELKEIALLSHKDESLGNDIEEKYAEYLKNFRSLEFFVLFSGKYDRNDAIFAIHAGAGGVEAQDWAEMLLRMILRYCEGKGFRTKVIDESRGQEAGIKSIVVEVSGNYAYGYLRSEAGVHRLVMLKKCGIPHLPL